MSPTVKHVGGKAPASVIAVRLSVFRARVESLPLLRASQVRLTDTAAENVEPLGSRIPGLGLAFAAPKHAILAREEALQQWFEKTDRALAAKALVQLGQAYERLGSDEARRRYERVMQEFGEPKDAVSVAEARLAAIGRSTSGDRLPLHRVITGGASAIFGGFLYASITPDGRFLANIDSETGGITVREMNGGRLRRFAGESPKMSAESAQGVAMSSDGEDVAYAWGRFESATSELRVVSTKEGSIPRTVRQSHICFRGNRPRSASTSSHRMALVKLRSRIPWAITTSPSGRLTVPTSCSFGSRR